LLLTIPVLFGVMLIVYGMVFLTPGDPIQRLAGNNPLAPSTVASIKASYHLDQPFMVQFFLYLKGVLQGDFGQTFTGRSVSDIVKERLPVTLRLALGTFTVEIVLGLTLALIAAVKRRTWVDRTILVTTLILWTIPVLVFAFVLQYVFGIKLRWFPVAGVQAGFTSYVLPCLTLGILYAASLARLGRSAILDNMTGEHIRAAVARGLPRRRVVGRHVLKNALVPIVTIFGLDLAYLMGGAVLTETIFNLTGIGRTVTESITARDYVVVQGMVIVIATIYVVVNLMVDVSYALLDPRIRLD
jgi:oligopeptide transport system permease protein